MKKLITLLLTLTMIISLFVLPSAAITEAEVAALKYTVIQQSINGFSYTADDVLFAGKYCMRGMAISQDGKYMFGGFLNPSGASAIEMFDTATGKIVAGVQFIQAENGTASYPKGLATDDRGYLYAALAYNKNYGRADMAIYNYADAKLNQLSYTNIVTTTEKTKTGVNGITVEKVNGTYYAYVVVNYDVDYLARFDVTDPANPVLDSAFGVGGLIDLQAEPYSLKEANYLDVDTDGTIYLACNGQSGAAVMVLSADGSMILNTLVHDTAYGVAIWGDYLFVTTQKTGKFGIYDKSLLIPVANAEVNTDTVVLPLPEDSRSILINVGANSLCNVAVVNDILFLGDQGPNANGCDQILAAGLTAEAAKTVASWSEAIANRLNAAYPLETQAPETTAAPETEAPATTEAPVTEAPQTEVTEAPATEAPATEAPATEAPAQTEAPKAEGGCGGMIAGAVAIIALLGTALVIKKRD